MNITAEELKQILKNPVIRVRPSEYEQVKDILEGIEYKYFENKPDVEIGQLLYCDERTVRRHKSKLVQKIAVNLYGADVNK